MGMDLFTNILVGVNLSDDHRLVSDDGPTPASRVALDSAERLAIRNGARLHVLANLEVAPHAEEMIRRDRDAGRDSVLSHAEVTVQREVDALRSKGVEATGAVTFGPPAIGLLTDALDHDRDLIVVGTRERGATARNLLGSTSLRLVRKAKATVWVARKGPHAEWNTVLCPVDFSELCPRLVAAAAACAQMMDARLVLVHVVDDSGERVMASAGPVPEDLLQSYRKERHELARAKLDQLVRDHVPEGLAVDVRLLDGKPAETILEVATEVEADLVVMGSISHSALSGILFGSTAEGVLPHLHASLLVMKPESFRWELQR